MIKRNRTKPTNSRRKTYKPGTPNTIFENPISQSNTKHPYSKTKRKRGSVKKKRKKKKEEGGKQKEKKVIISPTVCSARGLAWRDGWFDDLVSDG